MRLKITWPLNVTGVLGFVLVALVIVKWTAAGLGKHVVEVELSRNQTRISTPPAAVTAIVPDSQTTPASGPAGNNVQTGTPGTQTDSKLRRLAATEPPLASQTSEQPILADADAKEKIGRLALSYVGVDPLADEVWIWLINDPELSPKVRRDLIEDLNETGFSDREGRRPTVDDLPLIENRILLLEEHAQFAMDDVTVAAFAEAYKDLTEMWWRLSQQ